MVYMPLVNHYTQDMTYTNHTTDVRIAVLETSLSEWRTAQDKALAIAAEALDKRLAAMNEFRDQLKDQAARLATREELNALRDDLGKGTTRIASLESKFYIGGAGLVIILTTLQLILNYVHH